MNVCFLMKQKSELTNYRIHIFIKYSIALTLVLISTLSDEWVSKLLNRFNQKLLLLYLRHSFLTNEKSHEKIIESKLPTGNKENYTKCSVYTQSFIYFYLSVIFYDARVMKK